MDWPDHAGRKTLLSSVSLTSIGYGAFTLCIGLTTVTIPNSVTSIENSTFSGCNNLTAVYFNGNAPAHSYCEEHWLSYECLFSGADNVIVYYLPGTTG